MSGERSRVKESESNRVPEDEISRGFGTEGADSVLIGCFFSFLKFSSQEKALFLEDFRAAGDCALWRSNKYISSRRMLSKR